MTGPIARRCGAALALGLLCLVPACSRRPEQKPVEYGPRVSGKVTYKGEPVPYGIVLFFAHDKGLNPTTGEMAPSATATIGPDGSYEIANAPVGPVLICVATDPETDLHRFGAPTGFGAIGGPPMAGGSPPVDGGPPMAGGPPMPGGPPMAGGPPIPGGPPMAGGPPQAGGPPLPGGQPPLPKDLSKMPKPINPAAEKLSEAQREKLKQIHKQYGMLGKSPLTHIIPKDVDSLKHDIVLK